MKKRLLSLALSLALCAGLTVPVSAAKVPHIITWLDEDFEPANLLALSEGTFPVHRKGEYYKCGFVDETGKIIVPLIYNDVGYFSEGLAPVRTGKDKDTWYKWGYVDKTGKMVIPTIYENAFQFSEGVAPVEVEDGDDYYWEYIDKTGKTAIPGRFSSASSFYNGVASVVKDGKANYIDHNGNLLYNSSYQHMSMPSEDGMFTCITDGQWWIMNLDGTVKIPLGDRYTTITGFSNSEYAMFSYGYGTYWGWMNKAGEIVVPGIYTNTLGLGPNGLAAVARGTDGWGFVNEKGETVIPFGFEETGAVFVDGLINVSVETPSGVKWGFIDITGQMVIPAVYDKIYYSAGTEAYIVKQDGRYGFMVLVDETSAPDDETAPAAGGPTAGGEGDLATNAVLSPQKLAVDGENIDCEKYNIGGSNYFKLRDLAQLLNGTGSQFGVGFDAAASTVTITTGAAYESTGTELMAGGDKSSTAQPSAQSILIDGVKHDELTAYNIGGSNFFQLRELGNILGFEVGYDQDTNTAIVHSIQK